MRAIKQFETTRIHKMQHIIEIDYYRKTDYKSQIVIVNSLQEQKEHVNEVKLISQDISK